MGRGRVGQEVVFAGESLEEALLGLLVNRVIQASPKPVLGPCLLRKYPA